MVNLLNRIRKNKLLPLYVFFLLVVCFFIFYSSKKESIEGKWRFVVDRSELNVQADIVYTFTKSDTYSYESRGVLGEHELYMLVIGDYKIEDDTITLTNDVCRFEVDGVIEPSEQPATATDFFKFKIKNDTLILTMDEQRTLELIRVK